VINPGKPEVQCDGVDNSCGFEKFNEDVPVYTCGQGTELDMPASERRSARASRFERS
jgi:hypothetical protein